MDATLDTPVWFEDGQQGRIVSMQADEAMGTVAVIRLTDGRDVPIPVSVLRPDQRGGYVLPLQSERQHISRQANAEENVLTIPIIEEALQVGKQTVETGRARITKRVTEREEIIDDPLLREEVAIERVPVGRVWDGEPPAVRYDGERMIVPLLAEEYVVTKRLILKEELHIYRVRHEVHEPQTVTLRSEDVTVERVAPPAVPHSDVAFDLT